MTFITDNSLNSVIGVKNDLFLSLLEQSLYQGLLNTCLETNTLKTNFKILDSVQNDDYRGSITAKVKSERNFGESVQVWKKKRKIEIKMSKVEGYF